MSTAIVNRVLCTQYKGLNMSLILAGAGPFQYIKAVFAMHDSIYFINGKPIELN